MPAVLALYKCLLNLITMLALLAVRSEFSGSPEIPTILTAVLAPVEKVSLFTSAFDVPLCVEPAV